MRDEGISTAELAKISPAEDAVLYCLKRIKVDANLRYHMIGTEAFGRLCAAEAQRVEKHEDEVEAFYSQPADHCKNERPGIVVCREMNDAANELLGELRTWFDEDSTPRADAMFDDARTWRKALSEYFTKHP